MNKDEAKRALEISQRLWSEGKSEKALKFATKSISLHSTNESVEWLTKITNQSTGTNNNTTTTDNNNSQSNNSNTFRKLRKASNTNTSKPAAAAETPQREYTKEQLEAVKKIKACKDDYFAALGVERTATPSELKKAYRKVLYN